ncbi:MAG: ABC transporter ATP-binding protein [Coprobacillaceae bacterium]
MGLIELQDLEYFYRDGDERRYILRDINYTFDLGKFYTVLGESGSGKTTLLSLIAALDNPKGGKVLYEGKDIALMADDQYRRNKISIIFQSYNLVPYLTALENVLVAMGITDNEIPTDKINVAYNLLDYMGIDKKKAGRQTNKLSGGEQQRVAIARSLATNVDVILADEPTGNLDEEREQEIVQIFKKLAKEHNKCIIMVTHSKEIAQAADEVLLLHKGRIK